VEGHQAEATAFDLTDMETCARWVQDCAKAGGSIWGLVNNAGITKHGHVLDQTVQDYRSMYDLHVFAPFVLSKEAAKVMQRSSGPQRGRILSMSSIAGTHPRPGIGNYASSKAAIAGLTRSLAADFGRDGICANAIAPGYVLTEMNSKLLSDADFIKRIESRTPAARWAEPQEIANVAVFLLSEASSYVNGQVLAVDGGMNSFLMGEAS
jgi:gluconate 5-dehydrogenase